MNHIKLTLGFAFGISIVGLGGCQNTPIKSPNHALSSAETTSARTVAAHQIKYQSMDQGEVTRAFKSDVRGLRGLRGLRDTCKQVKDDFALRLLVPKRTGKTLEAQPTFYWWVSQSLSDAEFTFILNKVLDSDAEFSDPLIKKTFKTSINAGIQTLPMSQIQPDFHLEKGAEYEWTLLIACHPEFHALDIKATGTIMRVDPSPSLSKLLELAETRSSVPYLYAQHGIWYDAVNALSVHLQQEPTFRQARVDLMEQAGLQKVADYEKL